ncbi:MAG TPA: divalent metal cation transporter [Fulvivirga sp.]|nr:divalent metal cation transporter [Fulvivirga sp.]
MKFGKRIASILLWAVISAAFIGPGTLATASAAGSQFGLSLIWALVFSTIACLVLQEMSARIAIVTGQSLGSAMLESSKGRFGVWFVGFSVVLGCAAYQAGNILGAVSGLALIFDGNLKVMIILIGAFCMVLLWYGNIKFVTITLGLVVAIMGFVFLILAFQISVDSTQLLHGAIIPSIPDGATWIVLGLVGTTIVPYNLFLGAGVAYGQKLPDMRFGLTVSVMFGGLISIAILLVATNAGKVGNFNEVALVLHDHFGQWAYILMGIGLLAAGITSSITSPLAAGIIGSSLIKSSSEKRVFRMFWLVTLVFGLFFGFLDLKPIPVIIAAQALNGLVLPLMVVVLIIMTNNRKLLSNNINGIVLNVIAFLVLDIVLLIGLNNCKKALFTVLDIQDKSAVMTVLILQLTAILVLIYTFVKVKKVRSSN